MLFASVAYVDMTAGNRGGMYRQTDVDIDGKLEEARAALKSLLQACLTFASIA